MDLKIWYWIILVVAVIFGVIGEFTENPRFRQGFSLVLVILLFIIGFLLPGPGLVK